MIKPHDKSSSSDQHWQYVVCTLRHEVAYITDPTEQLVCDKNLCKTWILHVLDSDMRNANCKVRKYFFPLYLYPKFLWFVYSLRRFWSSYMKFIKMLYSCLVLWNKHTLYWKYKRHYIFLSLLYCAICITLKTKKKDQMSLVMAYIDIRIRHIFWMKCVCHKSCHSLFTRNIVFWQPGFCELPNILWVIKFDVIKEIFWYISVLV